MEGNSLKQGDQDPQDGSQSDDEKFSSSQKENYEEYMYGTG